MDFKIAAGSTSRINADVAPMAQPTRPHPEPAMWKVRITTELTECGPNPHVRGIASMEPLKLALASITPLGSPVVPDVYSWRQTSSLADSVPGSSGCCLATHAS